MRTRTTPNTDTFYAVIRWVLNNDLNLLSVNPTKWSSTLKQFVDNLPTNYLSVLDHFVKLVLKGLKEM